MSNDLAYLCIHRYKSVLPAFASFYLTGELHIVHTKGTKQKTCNEMALKGNKAVVNVQGDSENDLEALFRVIRPNETTGLKKEPVLPMRMRKLPPSFFTPGPGDLEGRQTQVKTAPEINPATGLAIAHSRAHSSPASLTVPKSSKKAVNPMQVLHMRSQSYDASETNINNDVVGPLPPGWEAATTSDGQKYFMNHIDQSTTWQDPRKTRSTSNLATNQALPGGWQQAITPGREVYYINHMNRTTSWVDPRLSNMNTGQNHAAGPPAAPAAHNNGIDKCNQMQLHRLQMEKQILQRRQQQLLQQEIVIKRGLLTKEDESSSMLMNLSREAFMGIPNNEQPQPTLTSRHMREESADSGLGLGTFYPGSDLDVVSGNFDEGLHENFGSKENLHQQNNNNNLRPGQLPDCFDLMPSSNVDVGLMDGTDSVIGMDTDDLGVGLEAINSDLMLSDVEAALGPHNKIDSFLNNLNWV